METLQFATRLQFFLHRVGLRAGQPVQPLSATWAFVACPLDADADDASRASRCAQVFSAHAEDASLCSVADQFLKRSPSSLVALRAADNGFSCRSLVEVTCRLALPRSEDYLFPRRSYRIRALSLLEAGSGRFCPCAFSAAVRDMRQYGHARGIADDSEINFGLLCLLFTDISDTALCIAHITHGFIFIREDQIRYAGTLPGRCSRSLLLGFTV